MDCKHRGSGYGSQQGSGGEFEGLVRLNTEDFDLCLIILRTRYSLKSQAATLIGRDVSDE